MRDSELAKLKELDAARAAQLRRDLALTAEARVLDAEHELTAVGGTAPVRLEQPRRFDTYTLTASLVAINCTSSSGASFKGGLVMIPGPTDRASSSSAMAF